MVFSVPGFVIVIFVIWYSVGVWKSTDKYFKDEYNKHLQREYRQNKYLKEEEIKKILNKEKIELQAEEEIHNNMNHDIGGSFAKKETSTEQVREYIERQQQNEEEGWIEDNSPPNRETRPHNSINYKIKSIYSKQDQENVYENEEYCSIKQDSTDCND